MLYVRETALTFIFHWYIFSTYSLSRVEKIRNQKKKKKLWVKFFIVRYVVVVVVVVFVLSSMSRLSIKHERKACQKVRLKRAWVMLTTKGVKMLQLNRYWDSKTQNQNQEKHQNEMYVVTKIYNANKWL